MIANLIPNRLRFVKGSLMLVEGLALAFTTRLTGSNPLSRPAQALNNRQLWFVFNGSPYTAKALGDLAGVECVEASNALQERSAKNRETAARIAARRAAEAAPKTA